MNEPARIVYYRKSRKYLILDWGNRIEVEIRGAIFDIFGGLTLTFHLINQDRL